jgi:hypothetical protein
MNSTFSTPGRDFRPISGDPVLMDLAAYLDRGRWDEARDAFFEAHTWTELLVKAGVDADEIIDNFMSGHIEAAQGRVRLAQEKAWKAQQEENERERFDSRYDG